jgi:hypothetical protein
MLLLLGTLLLTDSHILEFIQGKYAALCHNRLFQDVEHHYDNFWGKINLLTLHDGRRHFDDLSLINVLSGAKCCPSVLETVGIRVPIRNFRNVTMFTCASSHCPTARRVSAENAVCRRTDILRNPCPSAENLN